MKPTFQEVYLTSRKITESSIDSKDTSATIKWLLGERSLVEHLPAADLRTQPELLHLTGGRDGERPEDHIRRAPAHKIEYYRRTSISKKNNENLKARAAIKSLHAEIRLTLQVLLSSKIGRFGFKRLLSLCS